MTFLKHEHVRVVRIYNDPNMFEEFWSSIYEATKN